MNCCQCQGIEDLFNEKTVARELENYRRSGPEGTTRLMTDALKSAGVEGLTLLDIGGGVGAVQHSLLAAGAESATDVDASQAYITAARREAQRRGLLDRISFQHGNFVDLAAQLPPADVVTLDRVLCCYPDVENMVNLSAERARKFYGVVYPRDTWWSRLGVGVLNFFFKLQKSPFRTFVHSSRKVEAMLARHGLQRRFYRQTFLWQVSVYARSN